MADEKKRIINETTDTALASSGDYVIVDSQTEGTRKFDLGAALAGKVDTVSGKGLSTNDYTTEEKTKLAGIATGATNVTVDNTLSNSGQAADAKATGDEITQLKEDLSEVQDDFYIAYTFTTEPAWSLGGVNTKTGGAANTDTAIKTGYITDIGFSAIKADDPTLIVYAFDSSNIYLGVWNGTEFIIPSVNDRIPYYVSSFNMSKLPANTAKIRLAFYGARDLENVSKVHFLTPISTEINPLKERVSNVEYAISEMEVIHDFVNSIYSWWVYPVGIYRDRIRKCLYIGYVDNAGNQGIISKNISTGAINLHVFRQAGVDDHNGVSVNMLPDGRIMAICTGHAETSYHYCYISKRAENISEWDDVINIPLPEGYNSATYTQVLYVGDKWYMFYRCKGTTDGYDYWGYSVSSDGVTWGNDVIFLSGLDKKYYCRVALYDGTTVKLFMQSNYSVGETDIRLGYIDLSTGTIYNADHTSALTAPVVYTDFTIIIDKGSYRLRLFDVLQGTDNSLVYARLNSTGNGYVTMYARYDNGEWTTYEMPSQGAVFTSGYQNGVSFVEKDAFVVCRNLTDHWSTDLYDFSNGTFTLTKNLDATASSDVKMMRPVTINDTYALCNRGAYTNYNVYDCDIDILNI